MRQFLLALALLGVAYAFPAVKNLKLMRRGALEDSGIDIQKICADEGLDNEDDCKLLGRAIVGCIEKRLDRKQCEEHIFREFLKDTCKKEGITSREDCEELGKAIAVCIKNDLSEAECREGIRMCMEDWEIDNAAECEERHIKEGNLPKDSDRGDLKPELKQICEKEGITDENDCREIGKAIAVCIKYEASEEDCREGIRMCIEDWEIDNAEECEKRHIAEGNIPGKKLDMKAICAKEGIKDEETCKELGKAIGVCIKYKVKEEDCREGIRMCMEDWQVSSAEECEERHIKEGNLPGGKPELDMKAICAKEGVTDDAVCKEIGKAIMVCIKYKVSEEDCREGIRMCMEDWQVSSAEECEARHIKEGNLPDKRKAEFDLKAICAKEGITDETTCKEIGKAIGVCIKYKVSEEDCREGIRVCMEEWEVSSAEECEARHIKEGNLPGKGKPEFDLKAICAKEGITDEATCKEIGKAIGVCIKYKVSEEDCREGIRKCMEEWQVSSAEECEARHIKEGNLPGKGKPEFDLKAICAKEGITDDATCKEIGKAIGVCIKYKVSDEDCREGIRMCMEEWQVSSAEECEERHIQEGNLPGKTDEVERSFAKIAKSAKFATLRRRWY